MASLSSLMPPLPAQVSDLGLVRHQGPMLRALARTAAVVLARRVAPVTRAPALPGPELVATMPPRDPALVARFLEHVGSSPGVWGEALPSHLFPQWGFPLLQKTLESIPYPLADLLNGGARMVVHRPIPAGESLTVSAQLLGIDDDGRRAIFQQRLLTSTPSARKRSRSSSVRSSASRDAPRAARATPAPASATNLPSPKTRASSDAGPSRRAQASSSPCSPATSTPSTGSRSPRAPPASGTPSCTASPR